MKSFKQFIGEDGGAAGVAGPTFSASSGAVAGLGQPVGSTSGEPGVNMKKKKSSPLMMKMGSRKAPRI